MTIVTDALLGETRRSIFHDVSLKKESIQKHQPCRKYADDP